jgi:subtilisin family serine protease
MKKKLFVFLIVFAMLASVMLPMNIARSTPPITMEQTNIAYHVNPIKVECCNFEECEPPPGTVPFNVDLTDAEEVCETGEGIYVAVLDTGLLSNYLYFFPEEMVDIKEEWGIGYTHDVWYDPTGDGNWSIEYVDGTEYRFSYGPVRNDRGFLTYDQGNPLWAYYPPLGMWFDFPYGNGHGTHVTSIMTGWYLNRLGVEMWVRGVAPKVTIIPVLVLDDWITFADDGEGWWWSGGTNEMVAAGIRYVGDLAKQHKVKIIINMSLGGSEPSEIIEDAINYAIKQGVIIVAAAGNSGYDQMDWPGAYPQVISAAAAGWTQEYLDYYTDPLDEAPPANWYWWTNDVPENLWTEDPLGNEFQAYLVDFSSRPNPDLGQEIWHLDVSAPGCAVRGPYKPEGDWEWGYYAVWGTSQATPHVSSIAALVLEKYPKVNQFSMELCLKAAGVFNRMTKFFEEERVATIYDTFSDTLITQEWFWNDYGTGLLQADEALCVAKLMFRRGSGHGFSRFK